MYFAVGTRNKPKGEAVKLVLRYSPYTKNTPYSISYHAVSSGVSDMPTTLGEIRTGARNRAVFTRRERPDADYFVGMEGGVYRDYEGGEYWLVGVVYIEDQEGKGHYGYSCHLQLPQKIVEHLFDGKNRDLEQIVESVYGESSVGDKEGSFGLFSEGLLPRSESFIQATKAALVPHFSQYYQK